MRQGIILVQKYGTLRCCEKAPKATELDIEVTPHESELAAARTTINSKDGTRGLKHFLILSNSRPALRGPAARVIRAQLTGQ